MIGSSQYVLTWEHFATLHEDTRISFENLCRSLFQRNLCKEGVILHSDPSHPGVEVSPVLSRDGTKRISYQAKYFDNRVGYSQIKESAQKAVDHYKGELEQIYLYCNKDVTSTSESYKDIEKILNDAGIKLILITGQSILDQAADYPSVLSCYFGLDSITDEWFESNLQLSLNNLGKRYNSSFNVDTSAQNSLAIFLREPKGIDLINQKKIILLDELKDMSWSCSGKYKSVISTIKEIVQAIPDICVNTICNALNWELDLKNKCKVIFDELVKNQDIIKEKLKNGELGNSKYEELRSETYVIERLLSLPEWLSFSKQEQTFLNDQILVVSGEMGTGKSQLLATSARRLADRKNPVLLLLGQTYISDDTIEMQIMNGLEGLNTGESFESMLAVMHEKSILTGNAAVIFIDAINESRNRDIWKTGINRMIALVEAYSNVKLVISLRTGFEGLTLSDNVIEKQKNGDIASIVHYGFADDTPSSIYDFLSKSGIPFSPEYYLQSEMTNPLFLTWFCQTYSGEEKGLTSLIEAVLGQADKEASIEAGFKEKTGMLKPLLYEFIDSVGQEPATLYMILSLSTWTMYGVTNKIAYIKALQRAGVLASYVRNQEEIFYIGYNLLEDYLQASRIIEREQKKERVIEYCRKQLLGINEEGKVTKYGNESIFAMLVSLYVISFGEECIEIVDEVSDEWDKNELVEQYIRAFTWRSSFAKLDTFLDLLKKYPVDPMLVWNVFFENATKEGSELNAFGLTKMLERYKLNRRDYLWTTHINSLNEENRIVSLAYYIEAGNKFNGLSENKAFLLGILFCWMLSASNRVLRDRISKALVEMLKSHFSLCIRLLKMFHNVNDPYIIQRLFGIVFGAVMKRESEYKQEFGELAQWVHNEIFMKDSVYPDILLRDYARLIVERYVYEYPENGMDIDISNVRPPYKSDPVPKVEEIDYSDEKYHEAGMWRLLHSMKFDMNVKGVGLYGDFGRYTFQAALSYFVKLDVANVYYYAMEYIIETLGYTNEYFGNYDTTQADFSRNHSKRIERIGKKYQWIAMYNILARLSDTHNISSWSWNDKEGGVYQGPWNPYVRDFDPTLNTRIVPVNFPRLKVPVYERDEFLAFDASAPEVDAWVQQDDRLFQDFPERFRLRDENDEEWIVMYSYQENKSKPRNTEDGTIGFPKGEQHVWTITSMYILFEGTDNLSEEMLWESKFILNQSSNTRDCCYSLFSREYAWSPGYMEEFVHVGNDKDIETEYNSEIVSAVPASLNVLWEEECDASQDEATSFMIPTGQIIQEMSLYEKEVDGIYYYEDVVAALDLSIIGNEHKELVIRKSILDQYIERTDAKFFWTVVGEKQYFLGGHNQKWQRREGYFIYEKDQINGRIKIVDNL